MKKELLFGIVGASAFLTFAQQNKPNVVIFLTDDQGYSDMNRYGSSDLVTPNMDKICDEGVRFTQFYANSSISSPSRASLLTGRYPQRVGMGDLASSQEGAAGMSGSEITLAEVLKNAGYSTAVIGKWHLGYSHETMPNAQGFDYSFGNMGGCIDNYSHYFNWAGPARHDLWCNEQEVWYDGKNYSDLLVSQASDFIKKNSKKPFFLYFPINYPHYPLQGDAKWREYYDKKLPHPRNKYAAMVSTADEKIGAVIGQLEKYGIKKNTIIIFMSDNGYSTEDRTFGGGGSAGSLRGAKFSCYEGGIRVPAMISYPKVLPKNIVRNQIATGVDWFPTILDLCGIERPDVKLDGYSLLNVMLSEKAATQHQVVCWVVGENQAVRKGQYKMVLNNKKPDQVELFDFTNDESEQNNIANQYPKIVDDLMNELNKWKADVSARKK